MTAQATADSKSKEPGAKEAGPEYFPPDKPWRLDGERLHLTGMACRECGTKAFPAREVCSACGSDKIAPVELATRGKLYSFSEVHVAPKGFPVPYVVGYVDLDDGVRLFGQVEGRASELAIDQSVAVVLGPIRTRNDGTQVMSYKFRGLST
jgi:benzoylsuccinyl-CoA thiolase BbsA subunit